MRTGKGQEPYTGPIDETITVNGTGQQMSIRQRRAEAKGVIGHWKVEGHYLGAHELDAYRQVTMTR